MSCEGEPFPDLVPPAILPAELRDPDRLKGPGLVLSPTDGLPADGDVERSGLAELAE